MIDKCTFSVNQNDIETITGDVMQLRNELMTSDEMRSGYDQILKTGRPAVGDKTGTKSFRPHEQPELNEELLSRCKAKFDASQVADADNKNNRDNVPVFDKLKTVNRDFSRIIMAQEGAKANQLAGVAAQVGPRYFAGSRQLIIPLPFFFTKHVSQYFPLAAIAGCNDVRISIKFRSLNELIQLRGDVTAAKSSTCFPASLESLFRDNKPMQSCKLRGHFVHVTGPEAQSLMNREHVRLLKLYQHNYKLFSSFRTSKKLQVDLSLLHPVSTLIITIRSEADLSTGTQLTAAGDHQTQGKGRFFYHGDGDCPNYDAAYDKLGDPVVNGTTSSVQSLAVKGIKLSLNGMERHAGLPDGLDRKFLQSRIIPQLHSNSNLLDKQLAAQACDASRVGRNIASQALTAANNVAPGANNGDTAIAKYTTAIRNEDLKLQEAINSIADHLNGGQLGASAGYQHKGSKNIFVYPFSLNPEGGNPAGAVNFSKVSHARVEIEIEDTVEGFTSSQAQGNPTKRMGSTPQLTRTGQVETEDSETTTYAASDFGLRVDVHALYYNWMQIKDGRAILSFA